MKEKAVETKIKQWLRERNIFFFKIHGSEFMEGGLPDIAACISSRFVGIEVKRPGCKSRQSSLQKIQQKRIETSGGIYLLVDTFDDFIARISPYV